MEILKTRIADYVTDNSKMKEDWKKNTAQKIAEELKVSRNIVSQYLNEFVKTGVFGKINSRPVLFFCIS